MRTTVTLDPDVAAALKRAARERGMPFKQVLNDAVRVGLAARPQRQEYRLSTRPMRLRPGVDLDRALALAAQLEDDETIRKLELRK